jgi:hypothetical protein
MAMSDTQMAMTNEKQASDSHTTFTYLFNAVRMFLRKKSAIAIMLI